MVYDDNNVFAKILRKELPSTVVYEDKHVIGIKNIYPKCPIHILAIPKGKYISYDDFMNNASEEEVVCMFKAIQKIAKDMNLIDSGYRLVTNHGKDANQTVFHFHFHIMGGSDLKDVLSG